MDFILVFIQVAHIHYTIHRLVDEYGAPNARICMLPFVGSSRNLEPTLDAGEAVLEL
jgi:hypothetical protein